MVSELLHLYVYLSSSVTITSGGEGTWTKPEVLYRKTQCHNNIIHCNKSKNLLVTDDVGFGAVGVLPEKQRVNPYHQLTYILSPANVTVVCSSVVITVVAESLDVISVILEVAATVVIVGVAMVAGEYTVKNE